MTAPCDPEETPEARSAEPQIVLKLGDILPRVPLELLAPGPHDPALQVRFTVEELAEKIARGKVTVPLERLAAAFPGVFRQHGVSSGDTDVSLPLQKLLDQVGLAARKANAPASVPGEQAAQARAQAERIIEANASRPVPEFATAPSVHAVRIAKAITTARNLFGLFPKPGDTFGEIAKGELVAPFSTKEKEKQIAPVSAEAPAASPRPAQQNPAPTQPSPAPTKPDPVPLQPGAISLRAAPIFRLLPSGILCSGDPVPEDARVTLPLSALESQIPGGHVDIPLEDFIAALPEALRGRLNPVPGTQVWIPLDEIFQNLPIDHLFYMPPLNPGAEAASNVEADSPPAETKAEITHEAAAIPEPTPSVPESRAGAAEPETAPEPTSPPADSPAAAAPNAPADPIVNQEPPPVNESAPQTAPALPTEPPATAPQAEGASTPPHVEQAATESAPTESAPTESAPTESAPTESAPAEPAPAEPALAEAPVPEPTPPPPIRAPWMHGFQVPPPRLFASSPEASDSTIPSIEQPAAAPMETVPAAPPTPEAKRTADFLAGQPGIIAAAAFVEGAVFASADFPRRPDLDTLREFMGVFIENAHDCGRRLGWNRFLTIACEEFHLTAIVRDRHFIVALHHDRALPPLTHDALILAADDLDRASPAPESAP